MERTKLMEFYHHEASEILSECTHGDELYFDDFENKISGLWAAAYRDGVTEGDFQSMISEVYPEREVKFNLLFQKAA